MQKIGMVTIGQSPRNDILSVMSRYLPKDVQVLQAGALDGLDEATIKGMAPNPGEPTLVTAMRDGSEATVTHSKVTPLMEKGIETLYRQGAKLVVLLCAGGFEELKRDDLIIIDPGSLLQGVIKSLVNGSKLGLVLPSADQVSTGPGTSDYWGNTDVAEFWGAYDVAMTHASPYNSSEIKVADSERAAREMRNEEVDYIFLNCMGMDEEMKTVFQRVTQKPVVLASAVVARIVDELIN
jgi:protein AroM